VVCHLQGKLLCIHLVFMFFTSFKDITMSLCIIFLKRENNFHMFQKCFLFSLAFIISWFTMLVSTHLEPKMWFVT
jgi:hypothetical protein